MSANMTTRATPGTTTQPQTSTRENSKMRSNKQRSRPQPQPHMHTHLGEHDAKVVHGGVECELPRAEQDVFTRLLHLGVHKGVRLLDLVGRDTHGAHRGHMNGHAHNNKNTHEERRQRTHTFTKTETGRAHKHAHTQKRSHTPEQTHTHHRTLCGRAHEGADLAEAGEDLWEFRGVQRLHRQLHHANGVEGQGLEDLHVALNCTCAQGEGGTKRR